MRPSVWRHTARMARPAHTMARAAAGRRAAGMPPSLQIPRGGLRRNMVKRNPFPEEGELVVGTVKDVKGFGAFVNLDEYPGKEGFIHIAEVAAGWVKYVRDHVRENQKIVAKVLTVDTNRGHVDLSLKRVNDHQRRETIASWKNEQKADKLLEILGERLKKPAADLLKEFGMKLVETY